VINKEERKIKRNRRKDNVSIKERLYLCLINYALLGSGGVTPPFLTLALYVDE
jgi:hypothetical protein